MNSAKVDKNPISKISNYINLVKDGCVITGGHFMLKGGQPQLNGGTLESFKLAINLYKQAKAEGKEVGLAILINDIGMTCDANVCYVVDAFDKKTFSLPKDYLDILETSDFTPKDLDIYWEKALRNKVLKEFKRKVKTDKSIKKIDKDFWFETKDGNKLLLSRHKEGSTRGIPACPLIMASYHMEQLKRGWHSNINFYYVGIDNYENIPNHFMVEKGYEVAKHFGVGVDVKNIYFTDDKTITNF